MMKHGGDIYDFDQVLDFSVNVNPLGIPEAVRQAARDSIDRCAQYPDVEYRRLRRALARHEHVSEQHLICGNGAADLIFRLVFAKKPKHAVVVAPTFSEYEEALAVVGCEVKHHKLLEEENFAVTERILTDLTADVDLFFLCNPNNPTGQALSKSLLFRILNHCAEQEIFLVIDECFLDFLDNANKLTLKLETAENEHLFLLKAFTKTYAMAGLRLGYGICANVNLLDQMNGCAQPWGLSIPAQEAGIAAIRRCEDYLKEAKRLIEKERQYLSQKLAKCDLKVYPSNANFILFRCEDSALVGKLLRRGILVRSCDSFYGLDDHFYRVAVKTHKENKLLIQALKAERKK